MLFTLFIWQDIIYALCLPFHNPPLPSVRHTAEFVPDAHRQSHVRTQTNRWAHPVQQTVEKNVTTTDSKGGGWLHKSSAGSKPLKCEISQVIVKKILTAILVWFIFYLSMFQLLGHSLHHWHVPTMLTSPVPLMDTKPSVISLDQRWVLRMVHHSCHFLFNEACATRRIIAPLWEWQQAQTMEGGPLQWNKPDIFCQ